jgi:lipopolysaccharide export system protein LptC
VSTTDPLDFFDDVDTTAVPRAPRRKRKWLDSFSIYLPVALMGLLALASYWLLRATPVAELPAADRPVSTEPDYFMRRFSVKVFDVAGVLKTELTGVEARHYPATDTVEVDNGHIRHIGLNGLPTLASARLITTNGDNTEFVLEGNAVVVREAGVNAAGETVPRLEFRGEFLHIYTAPERVVSHKPVTLFRGTDRLEADTLDYVGDERVANFKGRVKVRMEPR